MTATATEKPLRLHRLEISNVLKVEAFSVQLDGKSMVISARNGRGKTSVLDAIEGAVRGFARRRTPEPIHRGAAKGSVTLDLGRYHLTRQVTAKGQSLVLTAADGSEIRSAQKVLDSFLADFSLDPIAWLSLRPQDQLDQVLALVGVKPPVGAVERLTGERHEPREGESAEAYLMRLSADETGVYYVRRRLSGRTLDEKKKALEEQQDRLTQLGGRIGPHEQGVTATSLLNKIDGLRQVATERAAAIQDVQKQKAVLETNQARMRDVEQQDAALAAEITDLEQRLAAAKQRRAAVQERIAKGKQVLDRMAAELENAQKLADAIPDTSAQIAELTARVRTVEEANQGLARRRAASDEVDRLGSETARAKAEHDRLEQIVQGLRELRAHLLDGVDLGVPELTVGEGQLLLHGVPFAQASKAEGIDVAARIVFAQKPELRILRLDDAEHLDRASLDRLLALAAEKDWQVLCARVAEPSRYLCGCTIVSGVAACAEHAAAVDDGLHVEICER